MTVDPLRTPGSPVVPGESFTALLRAQGLEPRWSLPADASLTDAPEGTTVLAFRYADGVLMAGGRPARARPRNGPPHTPASRYLATRRPRK